MTALECIDQQYGTILALNKVGECLQRGTLMSKLREFLNFGRRPLYSEYRKKELWHANIQVIVFPHQSHVIKTVLVEITKQHKAKPPRNEVPLIGFVPNVFH